MLVNGAAIRMGALYSTHADWSPELSEPDSLPEAKAIWSFISAIFP